MNSLILTVIGPDRPGLVDALSQTIKRHDANWLESHMAQLAGQFAGIIHVRVAADNADALTTDLVNLQNKGLSVNVTRADDSPASSVSDADPAAPQTLRLELLGHDRPGIVRDIAHALAARSINVAQLETSTTSAPMAGGTLFKAVAILHPTGNADAEELHDALDRIADELSLDLTLTADATG